MPNLVSYSCACCFSILLNVVPVGKYLPRDPYLRYSSSPLEGGITGYPVSWAVLNLSSPTILNRPKRSPTGFGGGAVGVGFE